MFFLGEILNLYFDKSTSSEKNESLKFSKFSFFKLYILDLLKEIFKSFCFKQEHIEAYIENWVLDFGYDMNIIEIALKKTINLYHYTMKVP